MNIGGAELGLIGPETATVLLVVVVVALLLLVFRAVGGRRRRCPVCGQTFRSDGELTVHYDASHRAPTRPA
jgi:hypothetical protein